MTWNEINLDLDSLAEHGRIQACFVPFSGTELLIFGGWGYEGCFGDGFIVDTSNNMGIEKVIHVRKFKIHDV